MVHASKPFLIGISRSIKIISYALSLFGYSLSLTISKASCPFVALSILPTLSRSSIMLEIVNNEKLSSLTIKILNFLRLYCLTICKHLSITS